MNKRKRLKGYQRVIPYYEEVQETTIKDMRAIMRAYRKDCNIPKHILMSKKKRSTSGNTNIQTDTK